MAAPLAPGGVIPPPVIQLPWGRVDAGGQVYLNPTSFNFLQLLWSAIQGGGGLADLTALVLSYGVLPGEVADLYAQVQALNSGAGAVVQYFDLVASEALAASAAVNVWSDGGAFHARNADTTSAIATPKDMHGFVKRAYVMGATARIWFAGKITGLSALTPGPVFLGAGGALTSTPNTTPGQISQLVGIAVAADTAMYQPQPAFGT